VTVTVSAPTLALSPAAGTLTAGTVGTTYTSQAVTALSGTAPYTYAVTSGALPAGMTLSTSSTISGPPTPNRSFSFPVPATDAYGATGAAGYTRAIGEQAPAPGAVAATVAANSSANPVTLDITGGAAPSVAIGTQASHGTVTASGTSISYTPTAG